MDPLSDLVATVAPRVLGAGGFDLAGAWSIGFPRHEGLKCYAVAAGRCWLAMEGIGEAIAFEEGDCILLPPGPAFRLTNDLRLAPVGYGALARCGDVLSWPVGRKGGEGDACLIVGGHFALDAAQAAPLLAALGPIVHLRDDAGRAAVRWSIERMRRELREEAPGASLMLRQLTRSILVEALRRHLADRGDGSSGVIGALRHPQLRRALAAIHADPARRWSVAALAREAGASRTSFAALFAERVGHPPIGYVTRWRMTLAAERLGGDESLTAIARSLGYATDSAFCAAYRRETGRSPRGRGRSATRSTTGAPIRTRREDLREDR